MAEVRFHTASGERSRSEFATLAGILLAAAAVVLVIGVGGDFPLSDDWSYAYTVQGLCQDGVVRFLPWTGASVLFQALYGAALCKLFGFSFAVLRMSTLVLATAGAVGTYRLLAFVGPGRGALLLGLTTFVLGPLYVNLSFTFMTDVPFTVLAVWAAVAYASGLDASNRARLLLGGAICAAALLIRQHGVFVAAAAAATALLDTRHSLRERAGKAFAASLLPAAALIAYGAWLVLLQGVPSGTQDKVREAAGANLVTIANIAFRALEYLGLLLLPIGLAVLGPQARTRPRRLAAILLGLSALAVFLYVREGALMPYLTNVLYDFGLGPYSLRDTQFLGMEPVVRLGDPFRIAVTVLATVSAAGLTTAWTQSLGQVVSPSSRFLLIAFVLLLAGSFLHAGFYFDRYLLPVLPFAIATALISAPRPWVGLPAVFAAAVLAAYAVAGTHDYMAWNETRFAALTELERSGIGPEQVDGGFEYNAWHLAAPLGTWPTKEEARPGKPSDQRSWWWVVEDRYVVAFRPLEGFRVSQRLPYTRWLPPGTGYIYILQREPVSLE